MILTLPLPPTDNSTRIPILTSCAPYLANVQGKKKMVNVRPQVINSQAYRDWKKEAEKAWQAFLTDLNTTYCQDWQIDNANKYNQYEYSYQLFKADDRKDSQNFEKALRDFLSGRVYTDDRNVKLDLQMPVEIDKLNPRIELNLEPQIYSTPKKIKIQQI